jgi:hypothetical protein
LLMGFLYIDKEYVLYDHLVSLAEEPVQHECVEEDDHAEGEEVAEQEEQDLKKGLGHEIEFKYLAKN